MNHVIINIDVDMNWYDYGARFYDPALGRWHAQDPISELESNLSPFAYVGNNPINFTDPTGMVREPDPYFELLDPSLNDWMGYGYDEPAGGRSYRYTVDFRGVHYYRTRSEWYASRGFNTNGWSFMSQEQLQEWKWEWAHRRADRSFSGENALEDAFYYLEHGYNKYIFVGPLIVTGVGNTDRPPKISNLNDRKIGEQIIDWMFYILNKPNEDDIYYNQMIAPDLYNVGEYTKYKGFIAVSKRTRDNSYGGVTFYITDPRIVNPNYNICCVGGIESMRNFYIQQVPMYNPGRGTILINIYFDITNSYYDIYNQLFSSH